MAAHHEDKVASLFHALLIAGVTVAILGLIVDAFNPNSGVTSLLVIAVTAVYLLLSLLANKAPGLLNILNMVAAGLITVGLLLLWIDHQLNLPQLIVILIYLIGMIVFVRSVLARSPQAVLRGLPDVNPSAEQSGPRAHIDSPIVRRARNRRSRTRSRLSSSLKTPKYRG